MKLKIFRMNIFYYHKAFAAQIIGDMTYWFPVSENNSSGENIILWFESHSPHTNRIF
jgi:hypothetical protein